MKLLIFLVGFLALFAFAQAKEENCDLIACPYNYDPVCAQPKTGGKAVTLGNDCAVRQYSCQQKKEYVIISHAECPEAQ